MTQGGREGWRESSLLDLVSITLPIIWSALGESGYKAIRELGLLVPGWAWGPHPWNSQVMGTPQAT